ncbi:MAG: winged helix-turn-helix transcriptional regulator [Deltaproteobacteria bacterium]|nr:winged helix-turn-helix transcriptional regulator [Deltaproteobacteria bacterium]
MKPEASMTMDQAEHAAEVLKTVAHPLRLRIVAILCEGDEHVTGLSERLGVPQAIVSQQLRLLRMRRLVVVTRENGFAHYHLAEKQLRTLVGCMQRCRVP